MNNRSTTLIDHPLEHHPHFSAWTDPASGVRSYILTHRLAEVQKSLYFQTPSIKGASQWLWFQALHPPGNTWLLGVVSLDPEHPEIRLFPGSPLSGNPWVERDGESCVAPVDDGLYRFYPDGSYEQIFRFPEEERAGRHLFSLTTTLDVTCDDRYYLLSTHVGNRWMMGCVDRQSGDYAKRAEFGTAHIHCFCSPTDPNLFAVNQNHWRDPITGIKNEMHVRMWLMSLDGSRYEPLYGDLCFNRTAKGCHEWFGPDGSFYWCDYEQGIWKSGTDAQRSRELIWPRPSWHGQIDPSGRYLAADIRPYTWNPCQVYLFDTQTRQDIAIASDLPKPRVPPGKWRAWHLDPHPHFSGDGSLLIYSSSAYDQNSVALCPLHNATEQLH